WLTREANAIPIIAVESTAKAAEIASKDETAAAIASEMSELIYGLKIVHKNIEDFTNNYTRFLVIGDFEPEITGKDKTSLMFSVSHKAGSLYQALKSFADNNINMTKIESRPSKMKAWEYVFYVDIDGHYKDKQIKEAIDKFSNEVSFFKILGSYPKGEK
ncbi:MAG: prephenate dehydratase, partial [Deferribacterales bacterium]|nr:prephenate dehydratase [Deferribacterales bacterium]